MSKVQIEATLFPKPQGGILGVVIGMGTLRGKVYRIAHAHLQEGKRHEVTVRVPTAKLNTEDLEVLEQTLGAFRKALENPAAYTGQGG